MNCPDLTLTLPAGHKFSNHVFTYHRKLDTNAFIQSYTAGLRLCPGLLGSVWESLDLMIVRDQATQAQRCFSIPSS